MKKQMKMTFLHAWMILGAMSLMILSSCSDDDEPDMGGNGEDPIASFQFTVSETNFLEVSFENFSQNATSYEWDFGDGNTSTEEDPTHTYEAGGEYEVTLTATNDDGVSADRTETITLADPNEELAKLAGTTSKTWVLQRESVALGIGPAAGDTQWWSFGGVTPLGDRPCILDDEYTFTREGSFELESNNTVFVDGLGNGGWNDTDPDVCNDEASVDWVSVNGNDMSAYQNGGDYNFDFDGSTLTLNGDGVYIGLPNKTNAGDIGDSRDPQSTLTYQVLALVDNEDVDSLHLALKIDGEETYWTFYLVHYDDESLLPDLPSAEPRAAFSSTATGLTVDFANSSANATSYSWDFGDGNSSTEENPTHTYASSGEYSVTLIASDDNGASNSVTQSVTVSEAEYTADVWATEEGKIWRLAEVAGSIRVGPAIGNGEWYAISDEEILTRDCLYDDEFILSTDGSFTYDAKGSVWGEPYMGVDPSACADETALTGIFTGLGSSTEYTFTTGEGTERPTITVSGEGAFLGFNKGYNGGEYSADDTALQNEVTYEVLSYTNDGTVERIDVAVDIAGDGSAWWTMTLQSF